MTLSKRIGIFLVLLGVILIGLFVLSDMAAQPVCNLLAAGGASLAVGILLVARAPRQETPKPERFRTVKKMMAKDKGKKAKK